MEGIHCRPNLTLSGNSILFKEEDSLLSNFRFWPLKSFGLWYHTTEAAYQWVKAKALGYHRLAIEILTSTTGREAKQLADANTENRANGLMPVSPVKSKKEPRTLLI